MKWYYFIILIAAVSSVFADSKNLLENPVFQSADGVVPDGWVANRHKTFQGAFTCTGGVLRISECAPAYHHAVSQTILIDGMKSHWFEGEVKCDSLSFKGNVSYSLLDASNKVVVADRPLFHPHFSGPVHKWARVGFPIPAESIDRVCKLQLTFYVYNDSRAPAEDRALYIRNPCVTEYTGQTLRPLPPIPTKCDGRLPMRPFPLVTNRRKLYQYEKGGVGSLNLSSSLIPSGKEAQLQLEVPKGVAYELHIRRSDVPRRTFLPEESAKGLFRLPKTVRWGYQGNILLFTADDTAPKRFNIRLTLTVGSESRVTDVPVEVIEGVPVGRLPKTRRYMCWSDSPIMYLDQRQAPLARAFVKRWEASGWRSSRFVHLVSAFPYRIFRRNPLARSGVGPHGTPVGIPCDSDLQSRGPEYYRDRLKSAGLKDALEECKFAVWDYEPYVVGPVTVGCFCEDCRRAFAREEKLPCTPSSVDILSRHTVSWVNFRCRQRAASVKVAVEGLKMLVPDVKFGLCTMPMAPYSEKAAKASDFEYLKTYGIDLPLFEDFTDVFCSMNYSRGRQFYDSLFREACNIGKTRATVIENGWGVARDGNLVGLHLVAAFFAGVDCPIVARGVDMADGGQLAEIRRALQFVADTEDGWGSAALCRDRLPIAVKKGPPQVFWSFDRKASDGTRYVLAVNYSSMRVLSLEAVPEKDAPLAFKLKPRSWKLLTFRPKTVSNR